MSEKKQIDVCAATEAEYDVLSAMYREHHAFRESLGFSSEQPLDRCLDRLRAAVGDERFIVLLAKCGHARAGFGIATVIQGGDFDGIGDIEDMFLLKEHRRCGAGKAILERLETWMREKGAPGAVTEVAARNVPALCFYTRNGYDFLQLAEPGALKFYQENLRDKNVTTSELSNMLRFVPAEDLPPSFRLRKTF